MNSHLANNPDLVAALPRTGLFGNVVGVLEDEALARIVDAAGVVAADTAPAGLIVIGCPAPRPRRISRARQAARATHTTATT